MTNKVRATRIRKALDGVNAAETRLDDVIRETCRPGDRIEYQHGRNHCCAVVIYTANGRVRVRSESSGKEYWIHAYTIAESA